MHTLELVAALARTDEVDVRLIVPPDLDDSARAILDGLDRVVLVPYDDVVADAAPAVDLVHRPHQVYTLDDWNLLTLVSDRVVLTYQDSILYRNPFYFDDAQSWHAYRRATRWSLGAADRVAFLSRYALAAALQDRVVERQRAAVVPIGTDHLSLTRLRPRPIEGLGEVCDDLLFLGTNLLHKNRPFAHLLSEALRKRHGWRGRLLVAGNTVQVGGSHERELFSGTVRHLGNISDAERQWLLANVAAVVYPSIVEGFGLVPLEAARLGTPCLFAAQGALAEQLSGLDVLDPWDAEASAATTSELLVPGRARGLHVAALRAAADEYSWDRTAVELIQLYEEALVDAPPVAKLSQTDAVEREALLYKTHQELMHAVAEHDRWADAYQNLSKLHEELAGEMGADGVALVSRKRGLLPPDIQRALLAVSARPLLRRALFAGLRTGYRIARRRGGAALP